MTASYPQDLFTSLLPQWHALLQDWSSSGRLTSAAQEALLLDGEPQILKDLVTQWSSGDFSSIPPIVLLSSADISGAMGAYAISTGTIYLNRDWLRTATQDQVNAVLTEELGHHLDGLLNAVDTPGDEGEFFSRFLLAEKLSNELREAIGSQNDSGSALAGKIGVEQANLLDAVQQIIFETQSLDLSTGAKTIWSELVIDSSLGPAAFAEAQWSATSGNARVFAGYFNTDTPKTLTSNTVLSGSLTFSEYYASGDWILSAMSVYLADGVILRSGGVGIPSSNPTTITVVNPKGDGFIPELTYVGFSQPSAILNSVNGAIIPITWGYSDEGSGVVHREAQIYDPLGRYYGTYDSALYLPPDAMEGVWTINNARVDDQGANVFWTPELSLLSDRLSLIVKSEVVLDGSRVVVRGNSLYTIVDGPSWTQAEANSVKLGGHLATIDTNEEDEFAKQIGIENNAGWIGLHDPLGNGNWVWSSGSIASYRNWSSGQPNFIGIEKWTGYNLGMRSGVEMRRRGTAR